MDNPTEKFGHFSIEKNKYGYFRFYSFKDSKGKEYDAFLKESFEALSKKKIKYLIVDVRGNTGGSMQVEFLRYLLPEGTDLGQYSFVQKRKRSELRKLKTQMREQPTKVYLRNMRLLKMNASKTDLINGSMTIEKPHKHAEFKGNIVVITDEGSFSAGAMLASHLKTLRNAKIVGAPSGGTFYGGNAGTIPVKLKKSNLIVQFNPNFFASNLFGEEVSPEIKQPDVEVFNESQIPQETYEKNKKNKKVTEDKILRDAEKALKLKD
jgi:C-terminal processing protease CtpA/Prc